MTSPIYTSAQFPEALDKFFNFYPVKVRRELKEAFEDAIMKRYQETEMNGLKHEIIPMVKSYKFKRK